MITAENKELKIRLQAMEQQAQLRDGMLVFLFIFSMFVLLFMGACRSLLSFRNGVVELLYFHVSSNT